MRVKQILEIMIKAEVKKQLKESLEPADQMVHKHDSTIRIELIEPTIKGWKVKQFDKFSKKGKIQFFNKQDIEGSKSLFVKE